MSSAQTGAHPSAEEVDTLLDPSGGSAQVAAHVAGCSSCAQLRDGLAEVRSLLRDESRRVPAPPPDLSARIASALAAERPLASPPTSPTSSPTPRGTVIPLASRRRSPTRWLAVAATLAVVVGGGAVVTQVLRTSGTDAADTAVSAGSAEAPSPGAPSPGAPSAEAATAPTTTASGTDYSAVDFSAQVADLLASASPATPLPLVPDGAQTREDADPGDSSDTDTDTDTGSGSGSGDSGTGKAPQAAVGGDVSLADPAALQGCLEGLGVPDLEPVAVDLADWQGQPAAVLVLRDPADPTGLLDVWAVPRDCGPTGAEVLNFAHQAP